MKSLKNFIMVCAALSIITVSCSKDDNNDSSKGSITSEGNLSGSISHGDTLGSTVDTVVCTLDNGSSVVVGKSALKEGKFDIKLNVPATGLLNPIKTEIFPTSHPVIENISDSTVLISESDGVFFDTYKNNTYTGNLWRANMDINELSDYSAGEAVAFYIYSNGAVVLKANDTDEDGIIYQYDLSLNKGWNEIIWKCTKANSSEVRISVTSNNEPGGMKWIFIPKDYEGKSVLQSNALLRVMQPIR